MIGNKVKILILLFLVTLISQGFGQETRKEKYNAGIESFKSGNYPDALQKWSEIYASGYRSAELEYNIGNAYFKLDNNPGAILFYERALLLKPADEDILYNLQIARTLVTDRFEEIPELFFIRWFNFLSLLVSTNSWAILSLAAFLLCLCFLSLYFYSSGYKLKVLGFWLALLMLFISAFSIALSARNKSLVRDSKMAVIFSPLVNGKSSPDNSGTDLFVLHEGTKVSVGDEVGEWLEIRLSDGNKGWIPANSLEII